MITRTYSVSEVRLGTDQILDEIGHRFDTETWLADTSNIALRNSLGDIALMEPHGSPGTYKGHYFYQSRGKGAVEASEAFLEGIFKDYPVSRLMGFTQLSKRGALWLTRHLGFTPLSIENINGEDYQVWTMHAEDYKCLVS